MLKYMVNVVISSHEHPSQDPIDDMHEGIILRSFGPCSQKDGDALADRINAWIRGGEGGGPTKALHTMGVNQKSADAWASCDPIPTFGLDDAEPPGVDDYPSAFAFDDA